MLFSSHCTPYPPTSVPALKVFNDIGSPEGDFTKVQSSQNVLKNKTKKTFQENVTVMAAFHYLSCAICKFPK